MLALTLVHATRDYKLKRVIDSAVKPFKFKSYLCAGNGHFCILVEDFNGQFWPINSAYFDIVCYA